VTGCAAGATRSRMTPNGHGGMSLLVRKLALNPNFRLSDAFAKRGWGHAARPKAHQGREQNRATSGFYPDLDQAPGATEDTVHRTSVRAIGRHPRGRHRAADRSTLYWHQARGVRRRGHPRREAGRRRVSLYRSAIAAGAAPPWRRRGRSHEEQVVAGARLQKGARHRALNGAVEDFRRMDGILGTRHMRTQQYHQRVGARGKPEPRDRAGQHLWSVRETRLSRATGL